MTGGQGDNYRTPTLRCGP